MSYSAIGSRLRQIRAEYRKALTPATVGATVLLAVFALLMQLQAQADEDGPSAVDWTGAVSISMLQHVTLLGVVAVGIFAGQMSGAEAATSSLSLSLTAEPRRGRLIAAKTVALCVHVVVSLALTAVTLGIYGVVLGNGTGATTTVTEASEIFARGALVLIALTAAATWIAIWSGSTITPALIGAGTFIIGFFLAGPENLGIDPRIAFAEATPYMWIVRWMQPEGDGRYIDFVAIEPSPTGVVRSGFILAAVALTALALTTRVTLDRAIRTPKGTQ